MEQPLIKTIEVDVSKGSIEQIINSTILEDFNKFKNKNKLTFCTMHQEKPKGNTIDVSFSTTIKYKEKLVDTKRLLRDFRLFWENNQPDYCQITKTSHQEGTFIAEFTLFRTYELNFTQK